MSSDRGIQELDFRSPPSDDAIETVEIPCRT